MTLTNADVVSGPVGEAVTGPAAGLDRAAKARAVCEVVPRPVSPTVAPVVGEVVCVSVAMAVF